MSVQNESKPMVRSRRVVSRQRMGEDGEQSITIEENINESYGALKGNPIEIMERMEQQIQMIHNGGRHGQREIRRRIQGNGVPMETELITNLTNQP